MFRLLLAVVLVPVLAGCVTTSNTLSPEQVAGFRLAGVNVGFARDASVSWADGEQAYAQSKRVAALNPEMVANDPEAQSFIRNTVAAKVKGAMQERLAGQLTGARPVRAEVTVREFLTSSVVQRVVIGGSHAMIGDVNLVDAKTGETLVAYPRLTSLAAAGQGVLGTLVDKAFMDEPIDRVTDAFARQYSVWLLRK
jgi:hypothetical protein